MQASKNTVVLIEYTLKGPDGQTIDSSVGRDPLPYLHGAGNIVPGLERAIEGKAAGDRVQVVVDPSEGYGQRDDKLVQAVPRNAFQGVDKVEPGMQFQANTPGGPRIVTVVKVSDTEVTVDANHPLAGVPLNFDVTIKEVRAANPDEIAHGHVHGAGGHHH